MKKANVCGTKKKKKRRKEKEGSEGRSVIFGLLFLTLAAPYKKGAFLLKKKWGIVRVERRKPTASNRESSSLYVFFCSLYDS
jgi:hypothetical protein